MRLRVTDKVYMSRTQYGGRDTNYTARATQKQGQTLKQTGRVSIRQDLPTTCRHPLVPQDLPSHPIQREEVVKRGERERKRKQDIDVKHAAHNHTDKMKR